MNKGKITDLFILETLGPPSDRQKFVNQTRSIEKWAYSRRNLELTFDRGLLTSFIKY